MKYYITGTTHRTYKNEKRNNVYEVVFPVYTTDGISKRKYLSGFKTKKDAEIGFTEYIKENCEIIDKEAINKRFKAIDPTNKESLLFKYKPIKELIDEYYNNHAINNKSATMYSRKHIFDLHILPYFSEKRLIDITQNDIDTWYNKLLAYRTKSGSGLCNKTIKNITMYFNNFFNYIDKKYRFRLDITIPQPQRVVKSKLVYENIWSKETFDKFISVIDDNMYKALYTMLFYTGRRKGEILALSPNDIKNDKILYTKSLTRKTMDGSAFNITTTKKDKMQLLPYPQQVKDALTNYKYDKNAIFLFGGNYPLAENTVTRVFQKYCKIAEVPTIRLHDLRHSFVSMLIHNGANAFVVANLIGDSVEQIYQTYGHLYMDDINSVLRKIS